MKKNNKPNFNKFLLFVSIVLLLLAISCFYINSTIYRKYHSNPVDYNELIGTRKDSNNDYVRISITDIPYKFATKDDKANYYIVFDENYYMYITYISDDTYESIENIYQKDPDNFNYEIFGYTSKTSLELKALAIEAYNSWFKGNSITEQNFEDYFGKTYLDATKIPYTNLTLGLNYLSYTLIISSIILIILAFVKKIYNKKSTEV